MLVAKTDKDIKPVLMDPKSKILKTPYYLIETEDQVIFTITPFLNGSEYNKTEGYFSNYPGVQTYQSLYGQGIALMQRNDELGEVKEFRVITLNPGRQFGVPAGWAVSLVNIGKNFLVVLGNIKYSSKDLDSEPIFQKQGLAYYVVEKKGEISFEQNPKYRVHPQITTE